MPIEILKLDQKIRPFHFYQVLLHILPIGKLGNWLFLREFTKSNPSFVKHSWLQLLGRPSYFSTSYAKTTQHLQDTQL